MGLTPRALNTIGFIILVISWAVLGFINKNIESNTNELPEWIWLIFLFINGMGLFFIIKAKKSKAGSDGKH